MQNYNQAQGGVTQLGNVLGLNGQPGSDAAMKALEATPGYKFQLQQGDAAINAQAAATGQNASGNQAIALSNYNQGLASTTYNNYVNSLMPFLGASNSAASGIAGVNTGEGNALAGQYGSLGGSLASAYTGLGGALNSNSMGLGNAVAGQYGNLAGLNYQTQTGIGNANANADLAGLTASGNMWNAIGSIGGAALGAIGGPIGMGIGSSLGSMIGGSVPGAVGASSVGGAPLSNSLYSSVFSDERLKEDIEPVGKLDDGQNVYRYRYLGSPVWQIGLMAQEVEKRVPEAVHEVGGFKAVNLNEATKYAAGFSRFLEAA